MACPIREIATTSIDYSIASPVDELVTISASSTETIDIIIEGTEIGNTSELIQGGKAQTRYASAIEIRNAPFGVIPALAIDPTEGINALEASSVIQGVSKTVVDGALLAVGTEDVASQTFLTDEGSCIVDLTHEGHLIGEASAIFQSVVVKTLLADPSHRIVFAPRDDNNTAIAH